MKKIILAVISYFSINSKKKFFLIVFILIVLSSIILRWPVHITLPVTGKVLDATTGKPIENAVIFCKWGKVIPSVGGEVRSDITSVPVATDKNGNYYIPMKITFHIISWFDEMSLTVMHPLYMSYGAPLYQPKVEHWSGKPIGISVAGQKVTGLLIKDGKIHYDVQLLSLEERYKEKPFAKSTSLYDTGRIYFNYGYFLMARYSGLKIDYIPTVNKWRELLQRYKDEDFKVLHGSIKNDLYSQLKSAEDEIKRIMDMSDNEVKKTMKEWYP